MSELQVVVTFGRTHLSQERAKMDLRRTRARSLLTIAICSVAIGTLIAGPSAQAEDPAPGTLPDWMALQTWNPCKAVTWSASSTRIPRGDLVLAKAAMRMIGKASGLKLIYAGPDIDADIDIQFEEKAYWGGDTSTIGWNRNTQGEDGFAAASLVIINTDHGMRRGKAGIRWQYLAMLSTAVGVEDLQGGTDLGNPNTGRLTQRDL